MLTTEIPSIDIFDASALAKLAQAMRGRRILCVGDVMLDQFVYGDVNRISPEAPVPVLRVRREVQMLGGAGNVVCNLAALGVVTVFIGVVGNDFAGRQIEAELAKQPGVDAQLIVSDQRPSTIKTRFISGSQQLIRADAEISAAITGDIEAAILDKITDHLPLCDLVVLSDYAKGVLTPGLLGQIISYANQNGKRVVIDPKGKDYSRYAGAFALTPNRHELAEATKAGIESAEHAQVAAAGLIERYGIQTIVAKLSEDGMCLVRADAPPVHLKTEAREVFDVSGAGDTVIAVFAAALSGGAEAPQAAALANMAAGIVVGKLGTATVSVDELIHALRRAEDSIGEAKIVTVSEAINQIRLWREKSLKTGFTSGCFEFLRPGHVRFLQQAHASCDKLIVGLHNDESARKFKRVSELMQPEAARAFVLASLPNVDLVVAFGEESPDMLIKALQPDCVIPRQADFDESAALSALTKIWDAPDKLDAVPLRQRTQQAV